MPLEEGRKEGAREAPHVAPLRLESKPGTNLAPETEVVDELAPDQGQEVQVAARFPAPGAQVEESHARPPRQWAAQERDPVAFPALERDQHGVRGLAASPSVTT